MQNMSYGQNTTFEWPKRVAKVIFPRFRGVITYIKVVSVFRFGHRKCHFWQRGGGGEKGIFHRAPGFLVWHVTQVNIWLERILDSCTTHFDQVLPNKYSWNAKKYGIFYYYGALGWMWSIQLPQNMFCKIFFSYRAFYISTVYVVGEVVFHQNG